MPTGPPYVALGLVPSRHSLVPGHATTQIAPEQPTHLRREPRSGMLSSGCEPLLLHTSLRPGCHLTQVGQRIGDELLLLESFGRVGQIGGRDLSSSIRTRVPHGPIPRGRTSTSLVFGLRRQMDTGEPHITRRHPTGKASPYGRITSSTGRVAYGFWVHSQPTSRRCWAGSVASQTIQANSGVSRCACYM